jgi:hypothetical protein
MHDEEHSATQREKIAFDLGPSVEDIHGELRDLSEPTLARYAQNLDVHVVKRSPWEYLPDDQRRGLRANHERARRERLARD